MVRRVKVRTSDAVVGVSADLEFEPELQCVPLVLIQPNEDSVLIDVATMIGTVADLGKTVVKGAPPNKLRRDDKLASLVYETPSVSLLDASFAFRE